jgi:mediator of RNA polymerase II transcription subunit 22
MSHSRGLPQSKEALLKSYTTRLKDDVKSMLENFEGEYVERE